MPALIENRPVETGLLAHPPSGVGNSAFGAGGHASGVEVFQHNGSEPRGKIKVDPVVPVLADTATRRLALAGRLLPLLRRLSTL